ncbi:aldo/keto reductase [Acetobacter indonesiensis NRIC 0313]|uniref:Aldo/keto reductase n=1 Tax=Acetobacter indonesiensis TaxID=104101 RepID=A0A6N3T5M5_9PROT|nr:aldo/keto reductase [Acetobacter indonesiensis]GAN64332.1 aldo/keto reductase [Acetobacter indonesiensis]GBQ52725.1 aldo/keto reductase [Acetobacter indonesiensis NRIC 0313]GEN03208.1 NADP-dependent aryl-alcohol dehydrogenase [Acetobacter indonesiensis]
MDFRRLGKTDLKIAPIVFGGNVFGWTIDEKTSFSILDAFVDYGFNAIDTADVYSLWSPGNTGGESETIIGNWLKENPNKRDQVLIFTKVGADLGKPGEKGLSARWILEAVERSLKRLGIERIDLYFSHWPDAETPYEETLGAYEKLLKAGKIRAIGASNLDAQQLGTALDVAKTHSLPRYDVLQPEYNLYDRASYDGPLRDLCLQNDIGVVTYYSLASGFLSGKYRSEADLTQSTRGKGIVKYLDARGVSILSALDHVAQRHDATQAEIALAWLIARKGVTAPIASATRREHVASFAKAATLVLNPEDITELDTASAV